MCQLKPVYSPYMDNTDKKQITPSISELLKDKRYTIADLCKKAKAIQDVNLKLKECLDPSLHSHFELANINNDTAILIASSSTWATRLRYNIPAILNALNNQLNFTVVKTIRIKVNKATHHDVASNIKPEPMSENTAQVLIDVANNFKDTELQECLLKLSKNYQK